MLDQIIDADAILADQEGWQKMLDRCPNAFSTIDPGGRIGVLANGDFSTPVGALDGEMMIWDIGEDGATVEYERFKRSCRRHPHRVPGWPEYRHDPGR